MVNPPGILQAGSRLDIVDDGGAGLHVAVFPRVVDVDMGVVVERSGQFGTDEAGEREGEGSHAVGEIGLESPQLVDAVIIFPEAHAAAVVTLGDGPPAGVIHALDDIDAGIGKG
ncbi:Uncharacterised protein [Collinsella aerofaciens]|nr:Uncharacterised protein [Collinsella aerofaciens]